LQSERREDFSLSKQVEHFKKCKEKKKNQVLKQKKVVESTLQSQIARESHTTCVDK
jgi:hypothetical protein